MKTEISYWVLHIQFEAYAKLCIKYDPDQNNSHGALQLISSGVVILMNAAESR